MGWNAFHNRGETLRAVVETANDRRDGVLPVSVPGVSENFRDELDLIGALLLKWHARLSGNLERVLAAQPMDPESAVAAAWRTTAVQLPGLRLVIDRCAEHPTSPEMEHAMRRAREHEWARLATAAGLASGRGPAAVAVGRRVEDLARAGLTVRTRETVADEPAAAASRDSFVDRIRAVLVA